MQRLLLAMVLVAVSSSAFSQTTGAVRKKCGANVDSSCVGVARKRGIDTSREPTIERDAT